MNHFLGFDGFGNSEYLPRIQGLHLSFAVFPDDREEIQQAPDVLFSFFSSSVAPCRSTIQIVGEFIKIIKVRSGAKSNT